MSSKRSKRRKEVKNKEVKKDLTPQFVNCDLADNKYSGIIREDLLGSQFLEGTTSTYIWSTGTKYEGPFVASQIEGRGTFVWPDGSKYEGELLGGRRNGEGCYQSHDSKTRYEGQWLDGKRHGQGKLTYSSDGPSFYDGGWQAGQKHGYGKQLWPSGNCYEGEWKLGKMHGYGTMIWKNGSNAEIYTGEWVENCPHGQGTHTWLTLDRPDSTTESWLNQPSPPPSAGQIGQGVHGVRSIGLVPPQELRRHEAQMHATQQLNNRYTGQWVWGRRQGVGTFYYANGAYYHGDWKGNVKEGHGRHTFDDGKVYDEKFEVDRMVDYSKPENPKDENPVCGCTDISDLEPILRPADRIGLVKAPLIGFAEPAKLLRGIFNVLLRHLGDLREAYSRSRAVQPLLGEDPHVITLVQFWSLARDTGVLTPNSSIARFDRAIFSGPRHLSEMAPEDEKEMYPLTPRRPTTAPRPASKDSTMTRHRTSSSSYSNSKSTEPEDSVSQQPEEEEEADLAALIEELCETVDSGTSSGLGPKYVRKCATDGNLVHIHAPARPLLFRHFLESFIRMAPMRFPHEPGLEQQVLRLFKEQVVPSLKNVSSHKSEGGGLISMLANFRRPTSSVFAELRAQVWLDISGARKKMKLNRGKYQQLTGDSSLDEQTLHAIQTDIDRTFPDNIHFANNQADLRPSLYNVLVAYAKHNPRIGYCQGLNYIAGLMLLIVRKEEAAFWLLDVIVGKLLPDYYAKDMFGLQVEQEALREVVRAKMPDLFEHIDNLGVSYTIFSTKWFICLYIDVLPVETVLRIWDCLFYEGSKVILRVALTMMSLNKERLLACHDFALLCTAMKEITHGPSTMDCHKFMEHAFEIPGSFSRRWIKELRRAATAKITVEQQARQPRT